MKIFTGCDPKMESGSLEKPKLKKDGKLWALEEVDAKDEELEEIAVKERSRTNLSITTSRQAGGRLSGEFVIS